MRIGLFTDTFTPGINGVVTVLTIMTRELRREGHEVYIFCPGHPSDNPIDPGVYCFPSLRFPFYKGIRVAVPYSNSALGLIATLDITFIHTIPAPWGCWGCGLRRRTTSLTSTRIILSTRTTAAISRGRPIPRVAWLRQGVGCCATAAT